LGPDDFGRFRADLAKTRKAVALGNEINRTRTLFRYGFVNQLIAVPAKYGDKFGKPKPSQVRRERRENRDANGVLVQRELESRRFSVSGLKGIGFTGSSPL
jgi:hypothetical protein